MPSTKPVTVLCLCFLSAFCLLFANNRHREVVLQEITINTERGVNRGVVLGAARLEEGAPVTEAELAAAVARVNRLDFVLAVDYRIVPLEQDRVRLEMDVVAKRPYDLELTSNWFRSDEFSGSRQQDAINLNGRYFVAPAQMLSLSVSPQWRWGGDNVNDGSLTLAYDHFNLFQQGVRLHVALTQQESQNYGFPGVSQGERDYDPTYVLGVSVPVFGDHSIWVRGEKSSSRQSEQIRYTDYPLPGEVFERNFRGNQDSDRLEWQLAWRFNALDSDFAPRRGLFFEAAYTRADQDTDYEEEEVGAGRFFLSRNESSSNVLRIEARRHHELSRTRSWFYGGSFEKSDTDTFLRSGLLLGDPNRTSVQPFEYEQERYRVFAGHGWDLFKRGDLARFGNLRLDLLGSVVHDNFDRVVLPGGMVSDRFRDNYTVYEVEANLGYRMSWGTFGLSLSYAVDE
ncbi:hypothetical protein [Acanthopleuribacter pedis]|uniref:POTRA domain-containing protein n=1 Tax=Acanthopleuribacter pedis TaxID=442870 RepID=A0A8J7U5U1_9BACT|nr:hypothetical protein [Acanthopleuribacter pedis]MBO1322908.1 hypothetical protein [Acanthopleuribacter pedis]